MYIDKLIIRHEKLNIQIEDSTLKQGLHIIIGANGSGKSSFLNGIIGLGHVEERRMTYQNIDLDDTHEVISYLPQDSYRFNLDTKSYIHMTSLGKKSEHLNFFDLNDIWDQNIETLSGGEFKRAQCAQIAMENKPVIIIDEIEAGLDVKYKYQLMDWLKEESEEKIVIASVHDLSLAMTYADYVSIMKDGRFITWQAPVREITNAMLSNAFDTLLKIEKSLHHYFVEREVPREHPNILHR